MLALRARANLVLFFAVIITAWPFIAGAQPAPRVSQCLNAAMTVEKASFKTTGKYIYDEDQLRQYMTATCASLRYEFSLKHNGFRVSAELNNETWSMDDAGHMVQLARGKSPLSPPSAPQRTSASNTPGTLAPSATFAGDDGSPTQSGMPSVLNSVPGKAGEAIVGPVLPDVEASERLKVCLAKELFKTKPCTALFVAIDQRCALALDPLPKICAEFDAAINSIEVSECKENEDNVAKCELRKSMVEKRCTSDVKQNVSECRWLNRYMAAMGNKREPAQEEINKKAPPPPKTVGSSSGAKSLDPSLRKLLRLRPVVYERKNSRLLDMGFVGEEVEDVDQSLVSYNDSGVMVGVRQDHIMTMTVSAVQELYGRCQATLDKQKDFSSRLSVLESENSKLKLENEELKKLIDIIKAKLDLK